MLNPFKRKIPVMPSNDIKPSFKEETMELKHTFMRMELELRLRQIFGDEVEIVECRGVWNIRYDGEALGSQQPFQSPLLLPDALLFASKRIINILDYKLDDEGRG